MKIKAILFDLDNTLYAYKPCNEAGKSATFHFLARKLNLTQKQIEELYTQARHNIHQLIPTQAAAHSRLLYLQELVERETGRTNISLIKKAEEIFWRAYFNKMKLRPGILKLFKTLRKKEIKIAIVSDLTTDIQMRKIKYLGLNSFINLLITSEMVGVEKPDPKMLKLALKKLALPAKDVIFTGDSEKRDYLAAKKMKMNFFQVNENSDISRLTNKLFCDK